VGIDAPRPAPGDADVATDEVIVAAGPAGGRAKAAKPSRKATTPAGNTAPAAAAPPAPGVLQLAISPWGEVEIDGAPAGTTPPLSRLDLPAGRHTVVVRNTDFPPYRATVEVSADQPAVVRHRFGS
jgi:serine/threonine-protein kinase